MNITTAITPATQHYSGKDPSLGVADMPVVDRLEMLCDWVAATHYVASGDVASSLASNGERFGYDDLTEAELQFWSDVVTGAERARKT